MTYTEFRKAWQEALIRFLSGEITEDELMEFGSLDELLKLEGTE